MNLDKFSRILKYVANMCLPLFDFESGEGEVKFRGRLIRRSALERDEKFAPRPSNVAIIRHALERPAESPDSCERGSVCKRSVPVCERKVVPPESSGSI